MSFSETMELVKKYVESLEGREVLMDRRDLFIKTIYEVERHFNFMEKDEKIPPFNSEEMIGDIRKALSFLIGIYVEVVITKTLYDFVMSYCLLMYNWNENVSKDKEIENCSSLAQRIYNQHMTVVECFETLKALIQRCERLKTFALPSVELSKHYLQSLDKRVEKK